MCHRPPGGEAPRLSHAAAAQLIPPDVGPFFCLPAHHLATGGPSGLRSKADLEAAPPPFAALIQALSDVEVATITGSIYGSREITGGGGGGGGSPGIGDAVVPCEWVL